MGDLTPEDRLIVLLFALLVAAATILAVYGFFHPTR